MSCPSVVQQSIYSSYIIFCRTYSEELSDSVLESVVDLLHTQLCSLVTMVSNLVELSMESHADAGGDDADTPTNEDNDIESSVITLKNQPLTSSMFLSLHLAINYSFKIIMILFNIF